MNGWIGVDLDGTLAFYDGWKGIEHIGAPVPKMQQRVQRWIYEGKDVRIFTARVGRGNDVVKVTHYINEWCKKHLGKVLPVTCEKDFGMVELWDDRCKQVIPNTGDTYDPEEWTKEIKDLNEGIILLTQVVEDMSGDCGIVSSAATDYYNENYRKPITEEEFMQTEKVGVKGFPPISRSSFFGNPRQGQKNI